MKKPRTKKLKLKALKFLDKAEKLGPTGKGLISNAMLNDLQRMIFHRLDKLKETKERIQNG